MWSFCEDRASEGRLNVLVPLYAITAALAPLLMLWHVLLSQEFYICFCICWCGPYGTGPPDQRLFGTRWLLYPVFSVCTVEKEMCVFTAEYESLCFSYFKIYKLDCSLENVISMFKLSPASRAFKSSFGVLIFARWKLLSLLTEKLDSKVSSLT